MKFGDRLELARKSAKLTQEELAKKSGVQQGTISKIERGDADSSTFTVQLAIACGVRPEWLAIEDGSMTGSPFQVRQPEAKYEVKDQVLEDLESLEPEDADVWRAQIRAAAIKARKAKQEKSDRRPDVGDADPPSEGRRIA